MAKGPLVEVDGLKQLRRSLKAAGEGLEDLKAANRQAADTAAGGAKPPVGPTGRLAGSIRTSGTAAAGIIRAGRAAIPYAQPIHWGWPKRGIPANPFLSDGATATESKWVPVYEAHIEAILAKIEGK